MNKILVGTILLIGLPIIFLKFRHQLAPALLFLVGLVVLSDSLWNWKSESALRARGLEAVVVPAGDTYTRVRKAKGGGDKVLATVKFRTAEQQEITEETQLPMGVLEKFQRGETVTVSYLPHKPSYYRFNPWQPAAPSDAGFGAIMMLIAGVWMLARRQNGTRAVAS
ncbi:hypothetical protein RAMLITH_25250 [Ramlibacter sp. RBP-2]|uniref:DUF3592 domain-containing protein n=1 Tax=Ramlibacter lithotrophicus TaxID=2606681 RepID=A0A7X6DL89_9BURK|nr:DUF3592 domain-containing protein [Ramlibacter lithotrophicus]NKE69124.1 hypothetical protein [Ramlibacter lithotrophicus]